MDAVTITLIIPVYNVEQYLEQCLESVGKQSIPFDEVVLVNDGSTDHSLEICQKYASVYKYFLLINQDNQGLSAARNTGMKNAESQYIMFLDSDDYLRTDTVKILKEQLREFPYDAVLFDADIYCEKQYSMTKRNMYDRKYANLDGIIMSGWNYFSRSYPRNYVVSACMSVYKRSVIADAKIHFPKGLYYEDNYFTFRYFSHAEKVIHISEKLYQRRIRTNSITVGQYSEKKFSDYISVIRLIWETLHIDDCTGSSHLKELLLAFISDHFMIILENYHTCIDQKINLSSETKKLLTNTAWNYFDFLKKSCINSLDLDLSMMSRLFSIFHDLKDWSLLDKKAIDLQIHKLVEAQRKHYIQLLQELPLNKQNQTIGIYGTGKHTEGFLRIYETLIGKVVCNLLFIDSQKQDQMYLKRRVINYQMVNDQNLDLIIISSFIYEQEMIENLKSIDSAIPVYTFYKKLNADIFSKYKVFLEYC